MVEQSKNFLRGLKILFYNIKKVVLGAAKEPRRLFIKNTGLC